MVDKQEIKIYTYPPSSRVTRGTFSSLDVKHDGSQLIYCSSNLIIIRDAKNLKECIFYDEHKSDTTCVKFSPNGYWAASGDARGHVNVWDPVGKEHITRNSYEICNGEVKDIAWSLDNNKVCAVGMGKQEFGRVFIYDTGATVGGLTGVGKSLYSVDFRPQRPMRMVNCGEEQSVYYFEGPPYKMKSREKDFTSFVNCIRYCPDGTHFVAVSSDKKIVSYEGKTGVKEKEMNTENGHQSGIVYCAWFKDNNTFATCSTDKTIKIWDVSTGNCIKTLKSSEHPLIGDQQLTIASIQNDLLTFSLDGKLHIWRNTNEAEEGALPNECWAGHSKYLSGIAYTPNKELISADHNGALLIWRDYVAQLTTNSPHDSAIQNISLSKSGTSVYSLCVKSIIGQCSVENNTYTNKVQCEAIKNIVASKVDDETVYAIDHSNNIITYKNSAESAKIKIDFEATCIDCSPDDQLFAAGNEKGEVHVIGPDGKSQGHYEHYNSAINVVVFSNDGNYIVSGDKSGNLVLYDVAKKEIITNKWNGAHTSIITAVKFTASNKHVMSASMDNKVIIWNVETADKNFTADQLHRFGCTCATFNEKGQIITGGGDNLIREITSSSFE